MFFFEVSKVFVTQFFWPPIDRIAFRLRTRVLRGISQVLATNDRGSFSAVEGNEISLVIHQVATQINPEIRILIKRLNQVRVVPSIFEMKQPAGGLGPFGYGVDTGDEADAGNQVNKQVSRQSLAVIGEAAPAEKPHWVKRPLGRIAQESVPINRLLACIRRNRIDPRAAWRVAVPVTLNVIHIAQLASVIQLFGL